MGTLPKVFVSEPIHDEGMKILAQAAEIVQGTSQEQLLDEAGNCDAVLVRSCRVPAGFIKSASRLKVIGKHGIGVDNIDVAAATEKGIVVVNAPDSNVESVAEHALGMIFALAKNFVPADKATRQSGFQCRNQFTGIEVRGKKAGIIGLGKIGRTLGCKLKALGVEVLAYDPFAQPADCLAMGISLVKSLDEIFQEADFISVHVPLTSDTQGMIGKNEFAKMKTSAFLLNLARGPIVREPDLYAALSTGVIRGAALDVFEPEPPALDNPLFQLDNVLVSPHNAALTEEALIAMATQSAQGIVDYLQGKLPQYVVNPQVLRGK